MFFAKLWLVIGWSLVSIVVYLSLTSNPIDLEFSYSDKFSHVLAYMILMGWFVQLYEEVAVQIKYAIFFMLLGISMEFLQAWGGVRFFEFGDMLANGIGVLVGWWLCRQWCRGWLQKFDKYLSAALSG